MIAHDREGIGLRDSLDHDATQSLQRDLDRLAGKIDSLVHARGDADATYEPLGVEHVIMVSARDHQPDDEARLLVRLEQRQILRALPFARQSCRADRQLSIEAP